MAEVIVPVSLGGSGLAYTDGTGTRGMASKSGYGFSTYLFPMLSEVMAAVQIGVDKSAIAVAAELATRGIYQGSYATDPLTRPDGSPRQVGDQYFNVDQMVTKRWGGAAWVPGDLNMAMLAGSSGGGLIGTPDSVNLQAWMAAMGIQSTRYASLNAAVTAIGSAKATLLVTNALPVTGHLTVPSTLTIQVLPGGSISMANFNLTINGQFRASRMLCFSWTAGVLAFGPTSVDGIYPEWFGAVATAPNAPVDSSAGLLKAFQTASAGTSAFTYRIDFAQGCYWLATGIDIPVVGPLYLEGKGRNLTSIRGMNGGGGYPDYLLRVLGGGGKCFRKIGFYSGSSTSPVKYGVDTAPNLATFEDCSFSYFSRACVVTTEWTDLFRNVEFSNSFVGIWSKAVGNNNDITVEKCNFVGCIVSIVANGGLSYRIRACQFQGGFGEFAPRTFIYARRTTNLDISANYFESQLPGMRGMDFIDPEPLTLYAHIVMNDEPFMDDAGVVTQKFSRNVSIPTTGKISNNGFMTPAGYEYAGGSGYVAGAANIVAVNGTGVGATGNLTVSSGKVTAVAITAGGTKFRLGDTVRIEQGAAVNATALVTGTTGAGVISALTIGQIACVYLGSCADMEISANGVPTGGALLSIHRDQTVSSFGKPTLSGNRVLSPSQLAIVLGSYTDTLDVRLGTLSSNMVATAFDHFGPRNMASGVPLVPSVEPPVASTLTPIGTPYSGMPNKRITLGNTANISEKWSGTFALATSGGNNAELGNRRVYFSVWRSHSAANMKLRLTLSVDVGGVIYSTSNYNSGIVFTSVGSFARDEVNMVLPSATATVTWSIEVIAAQQAAGQFTDIIGLLVTMVGNSVDSFPRESFRAPLEASGTWAAPPALTNNKDGFDVTVYGANLGDHVIVAPPGNPNDCVISGAVKALNVVRVTAMSVGATATPPAGTYRLRVTPRPS